MLPSKKRKTSVPAETDKEASQGPNHPMLETMQSEAQRPSTIESLASEADQDAGNTKIINKERQERFRALQARAVGIPSIITCPATPARCIADKSMVCIATATKSLSRRHPPKRI
jgi:DNA replication initiation complex subunit (GINS family)